MTEPRKPKWGDALPPDRVKKIWDRVDARLDAREEIPRGLPTSSLMPALAAVLGAVIAVVVLVTSRHRPPPEGPTALVVPDGGIVTAPTTLGDGSALTPTVGTKVEVIRSTATEFATLQRRGRCRYEVVPGGPRKWNVETDLATVEVIGAVFTVERTAEGLTVSVERGRVFVRRGTRAETLAAGDTLSIDAPPTPPRVEDSRAGETVTDPGARDAGPELSPSAQRTPSVRPAAERTSAHDVLTRAAALPVADAARELREWLGSAPRDADFSVVALRLGTIEHDRGALSEALGWFDAVIAVGLPAAAVEDASAHRIAALHGLGRREEARAAAVAFRARWPASAWVSSLSGYETVPP